MRVESKLSVQRRTHLPLKMTRNKRIIGYQPFNLLPSLDSTNGRRRRGGRTQVANGKRGVTSERDIDTAGGEEVKEGDEREREWEERREQCTKSGAIKDKTVRQCLQILVEVICKYDTKVNTPNVRYLRCRARVSVNMGFILGKTWYSSDLDLRLGAEARWRRSVGWLLSRSVRFHSTKTQWRHWKT